MAQIDQDIGEWIAYSIYMASAQSEGTAQVVDDMAKAIRFFSVSDSYGRPIEAALSESGVWFFRTYGWNGYGSVWSKWSEYEGPSFETHGTNAYTGEVFEWEKPAAFWGFNRMGEHEAIPRVRLPR